jgi:hypothetical protein
MEGEELESGQEGGDEQEDKKSKSLRASSTLSA